MQTYRHADIQTYIPTYTHTHIHTYTHTHIHTYIYIHIHTYIHTYIISLHCIALDYITLHYITLHICIHTYIHVYMLQHNSEDVIQRTINSDQWWLMWNIVSKCTFPQNFPFLVHSNLFKEPQNEIPTKLQNDCVIFVVKDRSFSSAHLEDFWLGLWPP